MSEAAAVSPKAAPAVVEPSIWSKDPGEAHSNYVSRVCHIAMSIMQHAISRPWNGARTLANGEWGYVPFQYMARPVAFADKIGVGTTKVLDATTGVFCAAIGGPVGRLIHNVFAAFMRVIVGAIAFTLYLAARALQGIFFGIGVILFFVFKMCLWDIVCKAFIRDIVWQKGIKPVCLAIFHRILCPIGSGIRGGAVGAYRWATDADMKETMQQYALDKYRGLQDGESMPNALWRVALKAAEREGDADAVVNIKATLGIGPSIFARIAKSVSSAFSHAPAHEPIGDDFLAPVADAEAEVEVEAS